MACYPCLSSSKHHTECLSKDDLDLIQVYDVLAARIKLEHVSEKLASQALGNASKLALLEDAAAETQREHARREDALKDKAAEAARVASSKEADANALRDALKEERGKSAKSAAECVSYIEKNTKLKQILASRLSLDFNHYFIFFFFFD